MPSMNLVLIRIACRLSRILFITFFIEPLSNIEFLGEQKFLQTHACCDVTN